MPKCAECGEVVGKLYPVFDKQGLMRRLCWDCYQKYHKSKVREMRKGQKNIEGYAEKYQNVPKLTLVKGEVVRE